MVKGGTRAVLLLALGPFLLAASGCGSNSAATAHLAGAVTIGGEPVPSDAEGAVSFQLGEGGETVSAKIIDGRYDSPNTPVGNVLVKFYISQPVGPVKTSERTGQEYREVVNLVPAAYEAGTPIEVTGDDPNRDFPIKAPKQRQR